MHEKHTCDVVVIGGGVVGCSIAYHLSAAGFKTALLEQGHIGAGASGANFGMVQSNDAELKYCIPMVKASYKRYDHLEEELGMPFEFRRIGSLLLLKTEEDWKESQERSEALTSAGIHYEYISPEKVREVEPLIDSASLYGAIYSSDQGQLNPFHLMWAFLRRGIQMGLSLHTCTEVTGFEIENGKMRGVKTNTGNLSAGMVVLATAAWTRRLGRTIGCDWNIHNFRASAMATEPFYDVKLNTIVATAEHIEMEVTSEEDPELTVLAISQTPDGHFLIAQANRPGESVESSISHVAPKAMGIMAGRYFPGLRQARVLRAWTAPTTFTDDGCPLIGPTRDVDGLILATSYRSAIIHSPLAGEIVTELVTKGRCDLIDISPFKPEREMQEAETVYTVKREESTNREQG